MRVLTTSFIQNSLFALEVDVNAGDTAGNINVMRCSRGGVFFFFYISSTLKRESRFLT